MRLIDWLVTPFRAKGDFHGGLHVPGHKAMSTHSPSTEPPLPPYLAISLRQIDGNTQIPKVSVGEKVLREQLISEPSNPYSVPRHAPTSGIVKAIEKRADVHQSNLQALHIVIEPDGEDDAQAPLTSLPYTDTDKTVLLNRIHQCGIAGMGGAGFPTARKLGHHTNVLVVNAAECEPYITCDDMQMREHGLEILKGSQIAAHILGADEIVVGIEDDKPLAIAAMRDACEQLKDDRVRIESVQTKYPSGNQRQLFELLLGIRVPNNAHATDYGLICHNSATMKAVYDAVIKGLALTERYVSVTGESVQTPQVFRARIGTPVDFLVEQAGDITQPCRWIIGGPMMGYQLLGHSAGIKKTTNCILLLPEADLLDEKEQACIRCSQCASACPMELLPQQLYWYSRNGQHERLNQYRLFDCIECGICASVCPSYIPLVQYFRHSKGDIREEKSKAAAADIARARHEARQARLEREALERKARMEAKRAQLKAKDANTANNQTEAKSKNKNDKQSVIEAAKARAEAKRQARLAQQQSASATENEPSSADAQTQREDKLAAVKAKAEQRRQARAQQSASSIQNETSLSNAALPDPDAMATHIEPISTDKDAIEESERQSVQAQKMANAQTEQRDTTIHDSQREKRLAKAKAKAEARRQARSQKK